jgi:hypothetical protein
MAGILDVIRVIPGPVLEQMIYLVLGRTDDRERRLQERIRQIEAWQDRIARLGPPEGAASVETVASAPPTVLPEVLSRITLAAGNAKEALRFAREDGMAHPEVVKRLAQAQDALDELERHTLRPEVLVLLPEPQRRGVEALMIDLRRARQGLHNTPDGRPPTPETLADAAAKLGALATQVRVMQAVGGNPPSPVAEAAGEAAPKLDPEPDRNGTKPDFLHREPYSRYAPEMAVDTGCLPCARAHIPAVASVLRRAAEEARQRGMADPDVQARIQTADEELTMLLTWDWTPERIAKTPPEDRAIIETIQPEVVQIHQELRGARSAEDLTRVAERADQLRRRFAQLDLGRGSRGEGIGIGHAAAGRATPGPERTAAAAGGERAPQGLADH